MCEATNIVRDRQLAIRREMDRRHISLKAVSFDSGIPLSTITSYFPGERDRQPAAIPAAVIYTLASTQALPLDLLSLVLPAGFLIVRVPEGIDHDEFERGCRDYLAAKGEAHREDSPGGRELSKCELAVLDGKVAALRAA